MKFSISKDNKKINVEREYAAPLNKVWAAWTQSDILDKWWAPKPWKAETKTLDFKEGGYWLYAMKGPKGETHWSRFDYNSIEPNVSFSGKDAFCDENGNINPDFPRSVWTNAFTESGGVTKVSIELAFSEAGGMDKLLEMGFKEGFEAGLNNLEALLAGK